MNMMYYCKKCHNIVFAEEDLSGQTCFRCEESPLESAGISEEEFEKRTDEGKIGSLFAKLFRNRCLNCSAFFNEKYSHGDIVNKAADFIGRYIGNVNEIGMPDLNEKIHQKAWNDATSYAYVRGLIGGNEATKNRAKELFEKITAGNEISEEYWKCSDDFLVDETVRQYSLGVWQKYSSMRFKYMFCIQLAPNNAISWFDISEYDKCACPIDRYIARSVFKIVPDGEEYQGLRAVAWHLATNDPSGGFCSSWSKIDIDTYNTIRESIDNYFTKTTGFNQLIFDLLMWETL